HGVRDWRLPCLGRGLSNSTPKPLPSGPPRSDSRSHLLTIRIIHRTVMIRAPGQPPRWKSAAGPCRPELHWPKTTEESTAFAEIASVTPPCPAQRWRIPWKDARDDLCSVPRLIVATKSLPGCPLPAPSSRTPVGLATPDGAVPRTVSRYVLRRS